MQRILILTLVLACSGSLYAQYEWAPLGATWTFNQGFTADDFFPEPVDPLAWKYDIAATADTVWNGMPARIVGSHIHVQDGYKVYYVWDDALRLLYDFSLEAGDTVQFELLSCTCEIVQAEYVVDSVRIDMINGLPLKRIHTRRANDLAFEAMQEYTFQEKIGQLPTYLAWGGTMQGCITIDDYIPAYLRCYADPDVQFVSEAFEESAGGQVSCEYFNPNFPAPDNQEGCALLVQTNQLPLNTVPVRLYPNPARHTLHLELEAHTAPLQFQLIHLSGIQAGLWAIPAGTRAQHLQLPELPAGIYIWTLQGEGMFQSGKLLVE